MSQDLINRYKKSFRIPFQNAETEGKYRDMQEQHGRSSSVLAFGALFILCLSFAYLEFRAFGHDVPAPMYGYILAAILALANLFVSRFSPELYYHQIRLIANGVLAMLIVISAVLLQKYSAYHALEFVLLMIWMGSLKSVRLAIASLVNTFLVLAFIASMYATDISGFWNSLVSVLLGTSVILGA